jgi:hypothetical protein
MRRLIVYSLLSLITLAAFTGCSTSKKTYNELKGLMLLENVQLGRNKAFYSKHSVKAREEAYKRYRKNNRQMNARRY